MSALPYSPEPRIVTVRRRHVDFNEALDNGTIVTEAHFLLEPGEHIALIEPHGIGSVVILTVEGDE